MTSFLTLIILFFLSACNPLAPTATESKIDSNHRPGVDQTSEDPVVSADTGIVSTSNASVTADGSSLATITITVKNISGTNLAGKLVTLTSNRGVTDTITIISAITDSSGNAVFTVSSTTPGSSILTAIADGTALTQTINVTFSNASVSSIVFSTQPSNSGNTDTNLTVQPVIALKDSFGNTVTSDSASTITLEGHSNASCSAVVASGISATTNPVTAASGVATFAGVKVLKTNVIRIKASDGTRSVCSNAIAISPGAAASIAFSTQPSSSGDTDSNLITQPIIQSLDANGNVRTSDSTSTITLEAHSNVGCTAAVASGISATTNPVTSASGVATFAGVKILKTNAIRIKATDGTRTVCSDAISISPGAAASIAFSTQPSTTGDTDTNLAQQPVVTVYDANGNIKTGHVGSITISANSNSMSCSIVSDIASGVSATTNPVTTSSGVSTFAGVKVLKTNAVRLRATDGTLEVCSDTFSISPGAISSLTFSTQLAPTTNNTDTTFTTQPVISAFDANSNLVTTNSSSVITLTPYDTNACGGSAVASGLSGTQTATLSSGLGTFTNITAIKTSVKSIRATTAALSVCSSNLTISPGALNSIAFSTQPAPLSTNADTPFTTQPVISAYDANLNLISNLSSGSVTLTTHTDTSCASAAISSGIFATTNPVTFSSGVATFAGVHVRKTNAIRIKASDGTRSACSNALTISAGAPDSSLTTFTSSPLSLAADNSTTSTFIASLVDQYSNGVSGQSVTLTSSRGATDTITTSPATTDSSGLATFTVKSSTTGNPTLTLTAGSYTQTRKLYFLSYTPLLDYQARYAKTGSAPGDTTVNQWWKDLKNLSGSTTYDLELFNFPTSNSSWSGTGASTNATTPYQLALASASNQYLEGGLDFNSGSDAYFETWIKPTLSSTPSSIVLSNADTSNKGLQLQQTNLPTGRLKLKLGTENTYEDEVLADNPVAFWRLSGADGYRDVVSSRRLIAPTNDVTIINGSTHVLDSNGYYSFPSTQVTHLNCPTTSLTTTLPKTFEAWAYFTSSSANISYLFTGSTYVGAGDHLISLARNNSNGMMFLYRGGWFNLVAASINTWHHLVVVFNSSGPEFIEFYLNGIKQTISQPPGVFAPNATANCYVGSLTGSSNSMIGNISDVAYYNTALSSTRVTAHYNARTRPACSTFSSINNNFWKMVSGSYNSSSGVLKLYTNGVLECSRTITSSPSTAFTNSTSPIAVGSNVNSAGSPSGTKWTGAIGELRVKNSVPSNTEAKTNYQAQDGNYPDLSSYISTISSLKAWYKADSITGLNDGDLVPTWSDSSNSNFTASAAAGYRPTYKTNILNGKPVLRFNSSAFFTTGNTPTGYSGVTLFLVAKFNAATSGAFQFIYGNYVAGGGFSLVNENRNGSPDYNSIMLLNDGSSNNYFGKRGTRNSANYEIYTFSYSNTEGRFYSLNGTDQAPYTTYTGWAFNTGTIQSPAPTSNRIGGGGTTTPSSAPFSGDIAEIIEFNSRLSNSDRILVEQYLSRKYNIDINL